MSQQPTTGDEESAGLTRLQSRLGAVSLLLLAGFVGLKGWSWLHQSAGRELGHQRVVLLVNQNSGRCLSVQDESTSPGAQLVQGPTPDRAGAAERWVLLEVSDGVFRLRNENSGLVAEIPDADKVKGVKAGQGKESPTQPNQHWAFEPVGDSYILRARHSELVLGIGRGATDEGAPAIQWKYVAGVADQLWKVRTPPR
jgi:hypothetical protein